MSLPPLCYQSCQSWPGCLNTPLPPSARPLSPLSPGFLSVDRCVFSLFSFPFSLLLSLSFSSILPLSLSLLLSPLLALIHSHLGWLNTLALHSQPPCFQLYSPPSLMGLSQASKGHHYNQLRTKSVRLCAWTKISPEGDGVEMFC